MSEDQPAFIFEQKWLPRELWGDILGHEADHHGGRDSNER